MLQNKCDKDCNLVKYTHNESAVFQVISMTVTNYVATRQEVREEEKLILIV